ncbi:MAG: LysR family transcriptional regulator [Microcystis sp. LE19-4.1E]|jgi:molybdate transport repressor ModE-like protein|nr:LysR family transcriptional regulator [Microcystis sp. LE19-4.1E]
MLNLVHVRSFVTVCECGTYRAAARALGVSASTILDHIRQLEETLAAPLLARRSAGALLTRQGERLLPLGRSLLATAERAHAVVAGDHLRIASASNVGVYLLQDPIAAFQTASGIGVENWIGPNHDAVDRLERGEADLAALEWWDERPGFEAVVWRREDLVVIVSTAHAWASRQWIDVNDLLAEPLLGGERGSGTGRVLREALGPIADQLRVTEHLASTEAVKRAVRAGRGISIVLRAAVLDELEQGHLVALRIANTELHKHIWLVTQASLPQTAPARACLSAIMKATG